ncbi:PglL family O-oligosaccharyltransferase [Variovorax sp. Varisp62]|uniref:PglL family O-oligosaccharyltransferase n=1 Tax=Variovorax sp. Varisp62 TaxID=3243049 RepID=UPI0039B64E99
MPSLSAALIALPFLFPWVAGPSVNVWQLLFAWACVAFLLLLGDAREKALSGGVLCWLMLCAVCIVLFRGDVPGYWGPACAAMAVIAMAALVGARMSSAAAASGPLAWGILAAGVISAVLGLLQYYGLAEPLAPWTTSPPLGQAYGNLRQRNQFATLISMALVAALWLYATQASPRSRRGLVVASLLLLVAQAASTSRTGLLQLLSIIGVASVIACRERRSIPGRERARFSLPPPVALLAAIPLYFAICWVLPHLVGGGGVEGMLQRLEKGAPDDHSRLILWHNVLSLIAERPWTGWGWGELSFAHYSTLYPGPRFSEILDNAHNLPLHLAVELGIPAAVLICGSFIWMVLAAKPWRERDPARLMAWGVLAMIVLHSLLEYPLWYGPFQLVFGLCLGMLWPGRTSVRFSKAPGLSAFAAAALMAIVVYASWDYIRISQIYMPRSERLPAYEDDTLAKLRGSWLFARQVDFAELTLTTVTPANAAGMHALAERTLHFSPEPRVITKLIESAELLGREDEARAQAERFRIAFPAAFDRWLEEPAGDAPAP